MQSRFSFALAACFLALVCEPLRAADGIAIRYPADAGIERDPAVLFADNFESGDLKKWSEAHRSLVVTNESPRGGRYCVRSEMIRGKNNGGEAKRWFLPGADRVYARTYVKFSPGYSYNHHFLTLLASPPRDKWRPFGKAGLKPDGTYFNTGMEPWFAWGKNPPPGELNFYSYFADMKVDPKMNKYWGNSFFPPGPEPGKAAAETRILPKLGEWQCWEFMIQANSSPEKADGRQAMWLDGKLVGEFTGIRWRTDMDARVNCFWLQHFGADGSDPTRQYWTDQQIVWFDDVVVAREYIGPAAPGNR
jgi:hypothetical protein